jgi:hypothetical protein
MLALVAIARIEHFAHICLVQLRDNLFSQMPLVRHGLPPMKGRKGESNLCEARISLGPVPS